MDIWLPIYGTSKRKALEKLSMFYIELKVKNYKKDIYKNKLLLQNKIKFELPKPRNPLMHCQWYSHTKSPCFYKTKCVKCAENQTTNHAIQRKRNLTLSNSS